MICFGWVLCHINHCRLFNAKSSLYIYIKYIWFALIWFYIIATIVHYLMLNPLYTYILNIICKHFVGKIFKQAWAHFFCSQVNGFMYFYLTRIILLTINHWLQTVKWYQVLLCISDNSINHQSFVYTQLNDQTVLLLIIQFSMFGQSLNVKMTPR